MLKENMSFLVVLLLSFFLVFVMVLRVLRINADNRVQMISDAYYYQVTDWTDRKETLVQTLSDSIAADDAMMKSETSAVKWLASIKDRNDDIVISFFANADADPQIYTNDGWDPPKAYNVASRPWYIGAVGYHGGVYLTNPYIDELTGSYCYTLAEAVYNDNGTFLGVFGINIYSTTLIRMMTDLYEDKSYAFLVDRNGDLINHPNDACQMTSTNNTNVYDTVYKKAFTSSGTTILKDYDGHRVILHVKKQADLDMTIVTVCSYTAIYGTIIGVGIGLMGLYIVAFVLITLLSRRHLKRLTVANEALAQANNAKTEFISRISHDIRTPIGAVLNLTDFAREDINNPEELSRDLDRIATSGNFLLSLINDVLDISKVDSGKIELRPEVFHHPEYLSEITGLMDTMCAPKHQRFKVEARACDSLPTVMVDKIRLRQIVLNLLSNAVKFSPVNSTITYTYGTKQTDAHHLDYTFTVKDEGIGMSEEFQTIMFDDFAQEYDNPGRAKNAQGTGLGLAILKRLVDLMGGTITVDSALGQGSAFTVTLPLDIADEQVIEETPEVADTATQMLAMHILLAEDNEINAEIALRIFEDFGVDADHTENGKDALEQFATSAPGTYDAVFMDIQMPVMNGYEAAAAIRGLDREDAQSVPIIAITADAYQEARDKAAESGMDHFMTKPFDEDKIHAMLVDIQNTTGS